MKSWPNIRNSRRCHAPGGPDNLVVLRPAPLHSEPRARYFDLTDGLRDRFPLPADEARARADPPDPAAMSAACVSPGGNHALRMFAVGIDAEAGDHRPGINESCSVNPRAASRIVAITRGLAESLQTSMRTAIRLPVSLESGRFVGILTLPLHALYKFRLSWPISRRLSDPKAGPGLISQGRMLFLSRGGASNLWS
jgi:hypothetical protein